MMERFTPRAREMVERAVEIATESRASEVRPEHLLAALLWDTDCLAVRVLTDEGADLDRLHAELDRRRSRYVDGLDEDDAAALASIGIDLAEVVDRLGEQPRIGGRRFGRPRKRFSRPAKKVLELSLREALALRHNYIGTEHLLLGLVRQDDVTVREAIQAGGIRTDGLRDAVRVAVRRAAS
jgi:ATP-dependent Clp protease ATP-binding subunit ClpA